MTSFHNDLYARKTKGQPTPEIGMGATILSYSDRHAATIQDIITKGKYQYLVVTKDDTKRIDNNGISEDQEYEYTPRPDGGKHYFRFDGVRWVQYHFNSDTNRYNKVNHGYGLRIGQRLHYRDPHF